jgi:hypothetical protein
MKKHFLVFLMNLLVLTCIGQTLQFPTKPTIWLRTDQPGNTPGVWADVSGHGLHAVMLGQGVLPDTCLFNYQMSYMFDSNSQPLRVPYKAKEKSDIVVFSVFKPNNKNTEEGIWFMPMDTAIKLSLSTHKLRNIYKSIPYSDTTMAKPTINMLEMQWNNIKADSLLNCLVIAGTDSLTYHGKFAEFMMFDTALTQQEIYKTHTYLAIKYGVSIINMNYVGSNDSVLWDYNKNIPYDNEIAGIGKDSLLQICQKQSAGNGGESFLKIGAGKIYQANSLNPSVINEHDYLIWGNNSKPIDEVNMDTTYQELVPYISQSQWLMNAKGFTANAIPTQLIFNSADFPGIENVKLVINRKANPIFYKDSCLILAADSIDSTGTYYFNNIYWDTDYSGSDIFGFQIIREGIQVREYSSANSANNQNNNGQQGNTNQGGDAIADLTVFPNPTTMNFSISISLNYVTPISVSIQDEHGKIVQTYQRNGERKYLLNGYLKEKGCYMLSVKTEKEIKTYKIVVQ